MKNVFLLLLICCSIVEINAQTKLYGLYYEFESFNDTLGTYSGNQYFVEINPTTASIEEAIEIDGVDGIYLSSSTLDAQKGQYIFYAAGNGGQTNLCKVAVNTGEVTLIPTSGGTAKEMEYDMQTAQLFGLRYNGIADDFVRIDLNTAEITVINALSNITATVVGTSTFDSNNGRYFIVGVTPSFETKLFTIDSVTGDVLFEVLVTGNLNELAYNVVNDKLIGLYRDAGSNAFDLVEIDFTDGTISTIADISNEVEAVVVGAVAFEYQTQTYIIHGIAPDFTARMFNIDALTGDILSDAEIEQNFIEFQADNVSFARSFYAQEEDCAGFEISYEDCYVDDVGGYWSLGFNYGENIETEDILLATESLAFEELEIGFVDDNSFYVSVAIDNYDFYNDSLYLNLSLVSNENCNLTQLVNLNECTFVNNETLEEKQISIYPNPTSEFLNIETNGNEDFEIYTISGQIIVAGNIADNQINVANLQAGKYILKISDGDKIYEQVFTKF